MKLALDLDHRSIIMGHAEAGYPREVCGFLLGTMDPPARTFSVREVRPAVNRRKAGSARRYRIDPDDYRAAEVQALERGWEVVGIYHSHPDAPARPSEYDREHAWPNSAYLIVSVDAGTCGPPKAWLLTEDRSGFDELALVVEPPGGATDGACSGRFDREKRRYQGG